MPEHPRQRGSRCTCQPPMLALDCPAHGEHVSALLVEAIDEGRVIQEQPPGRCDLCGVVEETRPYGPNGEEVCFACGMKNEEATKRGFERRFGCGGSS